MFLRFYFTRVVAHLVTLLTVPTVWWYYPKALLFVIKTNTAAMGWIIHRGVDQIPNPKLRYYISSVLQAGDWLASKLGTALLLVPTEYRDRVEVLARVRYEPGGMLLVAQVLAVVFFILWRLQRLERKEQSAESHRS